MKIRTKLFTTTKNIIFKYQSIILLNINNQQNQNFNH